MMHFLKTTIYSQGRWSTYGAGLEDIFNKLRESEAISYGINSQAIVQSGAKFTKG